MRSAGGATKGQMESPSIVWPADAGERPSYYLLSFYYMMNGNGISKLELDMRNETGAYTATSYLWKTVNNQGKVWKRTQLVIPVDADAIRLAFNGYRLQNNARGLIACKLSLVGNT